LVALGIGPGHEVVVSDVTWIASAAPVAYVGAMQVFADIDPLTWCLDPQSFAACITPQTRAVIPIDLYGGMPDMDAIRGIASDHGIAVIEDAAAAIGSQYRGRRAGAFGDTGVFSFHGSKTLTTGEGGMLVTDRDDLYERALVLRDDGRLPGDRVFMNGEVAWRGRSTPATVSRNRPRTGRASLAHAVFRRGAIGHGPGQSGGQMPNRLAPTKMHPVHSRSGVPSMVTRSRSAQAKNLPKLG
jgi:dTDP-4-amino-4,6-dideoxygalactose transaminase